MPEKACATLPVFEQRETHIEGEKTVSFLQAQYYDLSNTAATLIMAGFHLVRAIVKLPGPRCCACWFTDILAQINKTEQSLMLSVTHALGQHWSKYLQEMPVYIDKLVTPKGCIRDCDHCRADRLKPQHHSSFIVPAPCVLMTSMLANSCLTIQGTQQYEHPVGVFFSHT